jgi:hypothetical protein
MAFPLLGARQTLGLSTRCMPEDLDDCRMLFEAVSGAFAKNAVAVSSLPATPAGETAAPAEKAVDALLAALDPESLAASIGSSIDAARPSYFCPVITAESYESFFGTITSFYVHLMRHCRQVPAFPEPDKAEADALDVLERAFAKQGGFNFAWAEARAPIQGGLRLVLDRMCEEFKHNEYVRFSSLKLRETLDSSDYATNVQLAAALMRRLAPHLPEDVRREPPERYAKHLDTIIQCYLRSREHIDALIRTL